jgi:LuxR family maltose regulon positive regulatory protein
MAETSLLLSKQLAPRLPADLVARPALLARLDAALAGKLTLCVAPAGYGKSTLMAEWLGQRSDIAAAWLALDPADDDPLRFWQAVAAACGAFGTHALGMLRALPARPFTPPDVQPALTSLLNEAAALAAPAVLVLDDLHTIGAPPMYAALAFLIENLPPQLHLVITSRHAPPLPLARLRARGELCELDAADLRFTAGESAAFLGSAVARALAPAQIARLDARVAGWPAGLRLAALALRGRGVDTIEQKIERFTGSHPAVADYVVAEVLSAQPAPLQSFLLQSSALRQLTPALCDAVGERDDSAALISQAVAAGLFLQPTGESGAHRYHPLFAEALQHIAAERLGAAAIRSCHARASHWYEQHGQHAHAIDAALDAQDWPRAIALLEPTVATFSLAACPEARAARRWLERLPTAELHARPVLCFGFIFALIYTHGQPPGPLVPQLSALAGHAEAGWQREQNQLRLGQVRAARCVVALWAGQIAQAIVFAHEALALLPADDITWRGICLGFVGKAETDAGQLGAARRTLEEARALSRIAGSGHATRAHSIGLAHVYAGQCAPHEAAALYHDALADAIASADHADHSHAQIGLARLAYARNDLAEAERLAAAAHTLALQHQYHLLAAHAAMALALVAQARGQSHAAQSILGAALAGMPPRHAALLRELRAEQARHWLASGDHAAAARWAETRDETPIPALLAEGEQLLLARLWLAQGRPADARALLEQIHAAAQAAGRARSALECQLLLALALHACGQGSAAHTQLRAVLPQICGAAAPRLLLDAGPALPPLLRALLPELADPTLREFAHHTLGAAALAQRAPEPAQLLSRQEQRVLGLLASGCSNAEIAAALVVSVNTVKTQLKQIYRKLQVSSRRQAQALAAHLIHPE